MKIKSVKYIDDYQLEVVFIDNTKKLLDFQSFLYKATNPMIIKFKNKNLFKQVTIQCGSLSWNGEMDIDYEDVYNDIFTKREMHTA